MSGTLQDISCFFKGLPSFSPWVDTPSSHWAFAGAAEGRVSVFPEFDDKGSADE